jgi:3-oxo-5-alpha-steroid 4-dehydrogenase 1
MSEQTFFDMLIIGWFILAIAIFITLFFIVAPYGRYARSGWGPTTDNKLGWLIMESISPIAFAVCFALGTNTITVTSVVFFCLWETHYIHRAFIYPFSLRDRNRQMPIAVMGSALLFNAVNGYINGRYIFTLSGGYTNEWLGDPRFIIGLVLFITGFVVNRRADQTLRKLRKPGESDYKIPYGELYRWISCPNYFGEIITWVGWAVATWSLPGLAFAAWTAANLIPRARSHHAWYHQHFPNYPPERKALVPQLW